MTVYVKLHSLRNVDKLQVQSKFGDIMAWVKKSDNHWLLYIDGKLAGDVTRVIYNNGTWEYQGQAMNREKRVLSKVLHGKNATQLKAAVLKMAKAQRKIGKD